MSTWLLIFSTQFVTLFEFYFLLSAVLFLVLVILSVPRMDWAFAFFFYVIWYIFLFVTILKLAKLCSFFLLSSFTRYLLCFLFIFLNQRFYFTFGFNCTTIFSSFELLLVLEITFVIDWSLNEFLSFLVSGMVKICHFILDCFMLFLILFSPFFQCFYLHCIFLFLKLMQLL